ncbi:hypothetical protein PLESTM_001652300 [Pleodorina starrii]|nr:hypothetical protein PLESTM_001652300 [Pleodorina starrii]
MPGGELRQQLMLKDRQLVESARALTRVQTMASAAAEGELEPLMPVGAGSAMPKADAPAPKRAHATAKSTARRQTVRKAAAEEAAAPAAAAAESQQGVGGRRAGEVCPWQDREEHVEASACEAGEATGRQLGAGARSAGAGSGGRRG